MTLSGPRLRFMSSILKHQFLVAGCRTGLSVSFWVALWVTLWVALFLGLSAGVAPAYAAGNVGSGLIGNTVVLTGPAGTTQIFYRDRDTLVILMPDGKKRRGWWRVKGRSICTRTSDAPENCTPPIDIPPVAGAAGTIISAADDITGQHNPASDIQWEVKKGRAF